MVMYVGQHRYIEQQRNHYFPRGGPNLTLVQQTLDLKQVQYWIKGLLQKHNEQGKVK